MMENDKKEMELHFLRKRCMEMSELEIQIRSAYVCIDMQRNELQRLAVCSGQTVEPDAGLDHLLSHFVLVEKQKS